MNAKDRNNRVGRLVGIDISQTDGLECLLKDPKGRGYVAPWVRNTTMFVLKTLDKTHWYFRNIFVRY